MKEECRKYEDIIGRARPVSQKHRKMTGMERAAQFSPFAALNGYAAAIQEAGRCTDSRLELDENRMAVLDGQLQFLAEHPGERRPVRFTYFVPDERKAGGQYVTAAGTVRRIDPLHRRILLEDGTQISIDLLWDIAWEEE